MRLQVRKPTQALNKAYARQSVSYDNIETFRQALTRLFNRVQEEEPETHQRQILTDFLNETFYPTDRFSVSGQERTDLAIRLQTDIEPISDVLIVVQKVFAGEMMTTLKNNVRSLHELILHYFEATEQQPERPIKHLIITDVYNWFLVDERDFRQHFYENVRLQKLYQLKQQYRKSDALFYAEAARILRDMDNEVPVTCLNLREVAAMSKKNDPETLHRLLPIYKLFSPEHLLEQPFANNADTLNTRFYQELIHILGLRETPAKTGTRLARLPESERLAGSFLEQTMRLLQARESVPNAMNDTTFEQAIQLCISWLCRFLILKFVESKQIREAKNGRGQPFLTPCHLRSFAELNELFFAVVAVPETARSMAILNRFGPIPHLTGPLFALTELEKQTITIDSLDDQLELPLVERPGTLPVLAYLLAFLDKWNFELDAPAEVQPDNKPGFSVAMLGLIFEKLNGYRTNSVFTPASVVRQVVRDAVRGASLARFNEQFGWTCTDVADLANQLDTVPVAKANALINSLRIVDPAVGSGRFLIATLHELIALKAELGLLTDLKGRPLPRYEIMVDNDELLVTDDDGELVTNKLLKDMLSRERHHLLRHCLFGVDNSPVAISLCQTRLWLELLRHNTTVAHLPIHLGNALISRFPLDFRVDSIRNTALRERFGIAMHQYKQDHNLDALGEFLQQADWADQKEFVEIRQLETRLAQSALTFDFVDDDEHALALKAQLGAKKAVFFKKQQVYTLAFEWRFAFPNALNEAGNFVGFDLVISQPPAQKTTADKRERAVLKKAFPATFSARTDTSLLFLERGLALLRPGGHLALAVPESTSAIYDSNQLI